jgi:DNA repair exonuclease SbcCD nuclease subunit
MTARFLHTADWQIGKPFARVEDAHKRARLVQERIEALGRVGAAARSHGAEFIVVAGDVFDSPAPTRANVAAACAAIGEMRIPVFAIPGNHDHGGPDGLWERPFFQRERAKLAPNLNVLIEPKPVELESAVLFPCPLLRRREASDSSAWLREAGPELDDFGEKPRIVLAHGSVHDFGPSIDDDDDGGASNRLDLSRLPEDGFDYVALGDWHGMKHVGGKAWYAGTPEPDRFARGAANEPGHVLAVTAGRGTMPIVTPVRTARFGWHQLDFELADDSGLERLEALVDELTGTRAQQDLLRLELRGSLGIEATTRLEERIEAWRARLLRLKLADNLVVAPSPEEIESLTRRTSDPLIARVAARLVERCEAGGSDAACARMALRELHALVSNAGPTSCA